MEMPSLDFKAILSPGEKIIINSLQQGTINAMCVSTSVIEFERMYLIRFDNGVEKWMSNAQVRSILIN